MDPESIHRSVDHVSVIVRGSRCTASRPRQCLHRQSKYLRSDCGRSAHGSLNTSTLGGSAVGFTTCSRTPGRHYRASVLRRRTRHRRSKNRWEGGGKDRNEPIRISVNPGFQFIVRATRLHSHTCPQSPMQGAPYSSRFQQWYSAFLTTFLLSTTKTVIKRLSFVCVPVNAITQKHADGFVKKTL